MTRRRGEKYRIIKWALIVSILTGIVPLLFYWYKFGSFELSDNLETWSHFSDFFNLWVSLVSLILIFSLTYYISKIEERRYEELRELDNMRNRPILICDTDSAHYHIVKNIGIGPALNIKASIKTDSGEYLQPVAIPPLMAGDSAKINWMQHFNTDSPIKCLVYQDVFNNFSTTLVDNTLNIEMLIGENVLAEFKTSSPVRKKLRWNVGL
ncbi:hypothetical protein [Dyadobacter alkalitolerans]|uniref:hypothetical protein n=1 Tax=Dyadobacter alkalitolerans TaxID=492736 RepID=UPI00047C5C82|nr:hypothetical protein [Dyadobacter alkalitolerans]